MKNLPVRAKKSFSAGAVDLLALIGLAIVTAVLPLVNHLVQERQATQIRAGACTEAGGRCLSPLDPCRADEDDRGEFGCQADDHCCVPKSEPDCTCDGVPAGSRRCQPVNNNIVDWCKRDSATNTCWWEKLGDCDYGCANGTCNPAPATCTCNGQPPGGKRCDPLGNVDWCKRNALNNTCRWEDLTDCGGRGCLNGECRPAACTPGECCDCHTKYGDDCQCDIETFACASLCQAPTATPTPTFTPTPTRQPTPTPTSTQACSPGATRCSGSFLQTCVFNHNRNAYVWSDTSCAAGCQTTSTGARCQPTPTPTPTLTPTSTPDTRYRCQGDVLIYQNQPVETCPHGCDPVLRACRPAPTPTPTSTPTPTPTLAPVLSPVVTPDTRYRCQGDVLIYQNQPVETCAHGCDPVLRACRPAPTPTPTLTPTPTQSANLLAGLKCLGNLLMDGNLEVETCTWGCNSQTATCNSMPANLVCDPLSDTTKCENAMVKQCTAAGMWTNVTPCENGCNAVGTGCQALACIPGEARCLDDYYLGECKQDQSGWERKLCEFGCDPTIDRCAVMVNPFSPVKLTHDAIIQATQPVGGLTQTIYHKPGTMPIGSQADEKAFYALTGGLLAGSMVAPTILTSSSTLTILADQAARTLVKRLPLIGLSGWIITGGMETSTPETPVEPLSSFQAELNMSFLRMVNPVISLSMGLAELHTGTKFGSGRALTKADRALNKMDVVLSGIGIIDDLAGVLNSAAQRARVAQYSGGRELINATTFDEALDVIDQYLPGVPVKVTDLRATGPAGEFFHDPLFIEINVGEDLFVLQHEGVHALQHLYGHPYYSDPSPLLNLEIELMAQGAESGAKAFSAQFGGALLSASENYGRSMNMTGTALYSIEFLLPLFQQYPEMLTPYELNN